MRNRLLSVIAALWWIATVVGVVVALRAEELLFTTLVVVPGYGTVGGVIGVRRPTSPIGWLLLTMASVPLLQAVLRLSPEVQNGIIISGLALVLVLFPTGRPPGRIWLVPMVAIVVSWLGIGRLGVITLPGGFDLDPTVAVALLSLAVCAAAPIVRYRRAEGRERAQLQWLGAAVGVVLVGAGVAVAGLATGFQVLLGLGSPIVAFVAAFGIPLTIMVAILRHGLYDIDRLLGRAVTYSVVIGALTVVYIGLVVGVGALVGIWGSSRESLGLPLPIVATAVTSIGFQPARTRARRFADRLVFGRRSTPYQALAGISGTTVDEVLPQIARAATEATAARRAVVWLANGVELRPAAVHPETGTFPPPIPIDGVTIPETLDGGFALPLQHHNELLGAITVYTEPGESIADGDVRLLADLAAHAGVALRGALDAVPLPTGTVTFLMTDIEGSTRLWEEDAAVMAEAIRRHDALVRTVVTDGGGSLIKWRGEGDSTFSVFTEAARAVRTAAALQEAIRAESWPTSRPISVRAALHTGEAELRERDYFGRTVNRCARLRALAVGGQTLLTAATRELSRDALPESLAVRDLGERALKDMSEPEHVFELTI